MRILVVLPGVVSLAKCCVSCPIAGRLDSCASGPVSDSCWCFLPGPPNSIPNMSNRYSNWSSRGIINLWAAAAAPCCGARICPPLLLVISA